MGISFVRHPALALLGLLVAAWNSMRRAAVIAGFLLLAGLFGGSIASAAPTDALTGFSGSGNSMVWSNVGFEFSTSTTITVTDLGYVDFPWNGVGLAASHDVAIWRVSDQQLMVSAAVPAGTAATLGDNDYRFVAVSPTELAPGNYIISAVTTDDFYLTNLIAPTMSGPLSYVSGRIAFPFETASLIYPNEAAGNNHAPANFKYEIAPLVGSSIDLFDATQGTVILADDTIIDPINAFRTGGGFEDGHTLMRNGGLGSVSFIEFQSGTSVSLEGIRLLASNDEAGCCLRRAMSGFALLADTDGDGTFETSVFDVSIDPVYSLEPKNLPFPGPGQLDMTLLSAVPVIAQRWRMEITQGSDIQPFEGARVIELDAIGTIGPIDSDLDGVFDGDDNCIDVYNKDQDNPDFDIFGTACDNCPNVENDDQVDGDNDSYGDACDNDDLLPAEELAQLDPAPARPGETNQISATFKNPSKGAILTVRPDCFNTGLEVVKLGTTTPLPPRHLIRTPYNLALDKDGGDVIKLEENESYTVTCDLAEHFAPEVLASDPDSVPPGDPVNYEVTAHYQNDLRNPNCAPFPPGYFPEEGDVCPEITENAPTFLGVVSSATIEITVAGDPILPENTFNGSCTMVPSTWYPEWVGTPNREVTATITGVPVIEVVPETANIEFEGIVSPNSTSLTTPDVVVVKFDRSAAISALGSLTPGDTRFPDITGLLTGPTGDAFKAACRVEIGLAIAVEIDIKPGSEENNVNLGSNGNVPVAIFSTPEFDAASIDPTSVTLANANLKMKGKGTLIYSLEDINGDGLLDLLVHIETQGLELTASSESTDLAGRTLGGTPIFGTDSIQVKE